MPFLIALAAAAVAPQPGDLKTFTDWTVGCDNGRACQAVALLPEATLDGASLVLKRGGAPNAPVSARFVVRDAQPASVVVAGRTIALDHDGRVGARDVPALIAALRTMPALSVRTAQGKSWPVSLKGASASLLYMDDMQKRTSTVSALMRRGVHVSPPAPALPVVVRPAAGKAPAPRIDRAGLLKRYAETPCDYAAKPSDVEAARLDAGNTLVLVPDRCGSGAYNAFATALIADNAGRTRPAGFDAGAGMGEANGPSIVNGSWDGKTRMLSSYAKGRGIGDCGVTQDFAWDGRMFRMVRQTAMGECRGSVDYITTWRAMVR